MAGSCTVDRLNESLNYKFGADSMKPVHESAPSIPDCDWGLCCP